MQKIIIIGATSRIAECCATQWLEKTACELHLIGRNSEKLATLAADLQIRFANAEVRTAACDFSSTSAIQSLADELCAEKSPDIVLIAHGNLPDQAVCQVDLNASIEAINVNGVSAVLFAEAFAGHLEKNNHGKLAIISSVAGDRGRKSNYVYGAAKALVDKYAQGLQHRLALAGSAVTVTLIKPGPTDTPMTADLGLSGLASPEKVASDIVRGVEKGKAVVYTPIKWALIMTVIRNLPRLVFNKMDV